MLRTT